MVTITAEQAVRDYIAVRNDPEALRGDPAVAELQHRLLETDDPIARLQLYEELAPLKDPHRYERAFIEHAKAWADEHGVGPDAFRQEGVPDTVLRKAGILDGRGPRRRARASKRVTTDEIRAAIPSRRTSFTLKALQEQTGASAATVRNTISDMVARGEVEDLGPDPAHTGPGRAAKLYKKAAKR